MRTIAGLLRAQRLHGPPDRARVALVGQTALLLGGDLVRLEVVVGPGATLELSDIAATVAYHGRGQAARWHTTIRLDRGARLRYAGQPLVVSDGAEVTRTLTVELAEDARAWIRETTVLGRAGERGGRLDAETVLDRSGVEFSRERLVLAPDARDRPGVLAGIRVLDTVLALGAADSPDATELPDGNPVADSPDAEGRAPQRPWFDRPDVVRYALLDPGSTLTRFLGTSLADSPLP